MPDLFQPSVMETINPNLLGNAIRCWLGRIEKQQQNCLSGNFETNPGIKGGLRARPLKFQNVALYPPPTRTPPILLLFLSFFLEAFQDIVERRTHFGNFH